MSFLTKDQIQQYREAFSVFDKKSRGFVQAVELRKLLKTVGTNPTDEILEKMIIEIEFDENGLLSFEKLKDLVQRLETDEKNDIEGRKRDLMESKTCRASENFSKFELPCRQ